MLVTNEHDEALLGHRGPWAPGWFSTLAGFVEPGESAESAVIRELAEEVSIKVDPDSIVCLGSQPWPFPSSLMIGFRARATPGQVPTPDGTEITEARWFGRAELRAACEAGSVSLPARLSISRHLIEDWFGAELPGSWGR
jgi:NAD+ diphosphatase